jgi:hypothetical protein
MKPTRLSLLGAVLFFTLFSGCGPAWKVVRVSGPPSALAGQTDVAIAFDYSQMYVEGRSEADWVTSKTNEDAKYPTTWADLKARFEGAVVEGMRFQFPSAHPVQAGTNGVVMVVQVHSFRLGKFIPFVMPPTVMEASLVFQVGGQATDEISMVRSYPASITQPSVFNHIPYVGDAFGRAGGSFLSSKQP